MKHPGKAERIAPQFFVGWADEWVRRRTRDGLEYVLGRCAYVPALPAFRFWLYLDEDTDCYTLIEQQTGLSLGSGQPTRTALHQAVAVLFGRYGLPMLHRMIEEAIEEERKEVLNG